MLKCLKFQQAFFCCPEKSGIVKGRGKRRKWDESKLDSQALGILWIPLPHFRLCPAKLKCRNHAHMLSCTQSQKSFECGHTQTHLNATRVCSCVWAPPFFFRNVLHLHTFSLASALRFSPFAVCAGKKFDMRICVALFFWLPSKKKENLASPASLVFPLARLETNCLGDANKQAYTTIKSRKIVRWLCWRTLF